MDNATRQALLTKVQASGYPGSIIDVFQAHEQGVDLVDQYFKQQEKQRELDKIRQGMSQSMQQPPSQEMPMPSQAKETMMPPQKINYREAQTPTPQEDKLIQSQATQGVGLVNTPTGSYKGETILRTGGNKTLQEIAMYEWNSERPKQYLKGGLRTKAINRFATGGSRTCPEGYLWDDKLQDCVKLYTDLGEFKIANEAYQDSSDAYNKTKDIQNPKYYTDGNPSWYSFNGSTQEAEKFMKKNNMDLDFDGKFPGKIQPIETGYFGEGVSYPIYKKPQPVRYVEEPIRMNQKPIKKLVEYTTPATLNPASLPENIRQDMSRLQDKSLSWEDTMKKYSDKYPGMEPIYQMTNNREGVGNQKLMGFTYRDYYDQENPRKFRPKEYRFKVGGFTKMLYNKPKYKK